MNYSTATLYTMLNYVESKIPSPPPWKSGLLPAERLWIGEYGWGGTQSTDQQEPTTRAYIQRLLGFGGKSLPYILFWEMYNNEPNKLYCLIDSNNVKTACYYLHQRFINSARLSVARFKETNHRLPTDPEFVSLVSPMLNRPLPAPVSLSVANGGYDLLTASSASVSGVLAQGIYGDDCATVRVFWGRQDGAAVRGAWEHSLTLGLNTNFNPRTFTVMLTNLAPNTNYFFRFCATNATGEAWAPASTLLNTALINPSDFGCRLLISFTGYNRPEVLSNFPALVILSTNLPGFSYRQFASAVGADLRFADAEGVRPLSFEIDEWNTNGNSSVWVQVPRLSGASDSIWAYWGNPAATALPRANSSVVWTPSFLLVYHLKESAFPFDDSADRHPALSGVAPALAPGVVGHGCVFNGSSHFLDAGLVDLGDVFTLSAWVNVNPTADDIQTIWANQHGGYGAPGFAWFINTYTTADRKIDFASGDDTIGAETTTAAGAVSFGQWHLLAAAVNRTDATVELFLDGARILSGRTITNFPTFVDLNLGRFTNDVFYFKGSMDEVRIQKGAASLNWNWASWMTVAANAALENYSPVVLQAPRLSLSQNGGALLFQWPAAGVAFALYSSTTLVPPVVWTLVTNPPSLAGGQWQISLPIQANATRFFRLQPVL